MGIGDTANRGTADNLSAEMIDGVKEFQSTFRNTFQIKIINELLFEGGFDPVINVDDEITFEFSEIELDAKIKKENHVVQLFVQNAITHEELRTLMGLDPVTDEGRLYFNMVTIPIAVQTAEASAAASAQTDAANNAGSNKDQPTNQNGTKSSPKKTSASVEESQNDESITVEEDFSTKQLTESTQRVNLLSELRISKTSESLHKIWNAVREDVVTMIRQGKSKNDIQALVIHLAKQTLRSHIENDLTNAFYLGLSHGRTALNVGSIGNDTYLQLDKAKKVATTFTDKLANDMRDLILKAMDQEDSVEKISLVTGAFNSNTYRIDFISKTELYRTYNYGLALVAKAAKMEHVEVFNDNPDCGSCVEKAGQGVDLSSDSLLDAIPPHHPNCTCTIQLNTNSSEGGVG
jgi:cytochrome c-type biogenesis protein CcmH/NrfF